MRARVLRLGLALIGAWALPLRTTGAALGDPLTFALDVLRGDLGVSPTSGIDVDARVRVHLVGSLALGVLAVGFAFGLGGFVVARRGPRVRGRAGWASVVVVPAVVASVERWADAVPSGARLGASVVDRGASLVVPVCALGGVLAWMMWARADGDRLRAVLARDWPVLVLGVLVGEVAFGRPGVGTLAVQAVGTRDVALARGVVLVVATALAVRPAGRDHLGLRREPSAAGLLLGAVGSAIAVAAIVLADVLVDAGPAAVRHAPGAGPALGRLLGSDAEGHDVLARTLEAGRGSLAVGIAAVGVALAVGGLVGAVVGATRGPIETWAQRNLESLVVLPVVGWCALTVGSRSAPTVAVVIGVVSATAFARLIAPLVDSGFRSSSWRHLPGAWLAVTGVAVATFGAAIALEAALSLLGTGADGGATLGKEIAAQLPAAADASWGAIGPALGLAVLVGALGALGHGVAVISAPMALQSAVDGSPHPGA